VEKSATDQKSLEVRPSQPRRANWPAIFAVLLLGVATFLVSCSLAGQKTSVELESTPISAEQLAADYGLRVHLIGVTAAGGMIDLRLKILDPQKAQQFLEEPAHLPELIAADSGDALLPSEGLDDDIEWTEGGILFNFFSNDNGLIESGTPVIVQFGDKQIESIEAQ
jgi:hypothetical protein